MIITGGVSRLQSRTGATAADLSLVKEQIQIPHSADDTLLSTLIIPAAIAEVENRGSVALTTQTRRLYVSAMWAACLPGESILLTHGPIQSIESVTYLDSDHAEQSYTDFHLASGQYCHFKTSFDSTVAGGEGAVWVDYTCGFGDDLADVPEALLQCVYVMCMRRYEFRDGVDGRSDQHWERAFNNMIFNALGGTVG